MRTPQTSEEGAQDVEKAASHGAPTELSRLSTEDQNYYVTMKTWLVVWVSDGPCAAHVF